MKKFILPIATLMIIAFSFQSCTKEKPLTPEEAKVKVDKADQDISSMIYSFKHGEAVSTLQNFINYSKKKIAKSKADEYWIDDMFEKLDEVIDFNALDDEFENNHRFFFEHYTGKYSWNHTTQTWDKSSSDLIIFEFPSTESSNINDAVLSFYSYQDTYVNHDDYNFYPPTSLHADFKINNIKLAGIDLNEVDYNTTGIVLYKKIDLSIFLKPLTFNFFYENRTPTNFFSYANITDNTNTLGATANLNTLTPVTEDFDEEDLKDISGNVFINNLKFTYFVNLQNIINFDTEPTIAQINENINVDVYVSNDKIGYLYLDSDDNVYIIYNDGSRELFEDAFSNVIIELNNFVDDFSKNNKSLAKKQKRKLIKFIIFKTGGYKNLKRFIKYEHNVLSKK